MAKFCTKCGNELDEKAVACPKCGNKVENAQNPVVEKKSNGMAIAGFVLSFIFALLGLIFSIIGLNNSKTTKSGRGLSIAGIIISSIRMIATAILLIFCFAYFTTEVSSYSEEEAKKYIEDKIKEYTEQVEKYDNNDYDFDFDYDD